MSTSSERLILDSFANLASQEAGELALRNGSRVAVIGGGPASSFFSYFLLKMATAVDLDVEVDIYEPRSFGYCGPAGCNHCGGIISESLVQILATEGIALPDSVVQRGIESYVVHMDVGDVSIQSPVYESRIAALYRGNGPREGGDAPLASFDGYLQGMAIERGARVIRNLVTGIDWREGYPYLKFVDHSTEGYDLVAVAAGVNSNIIRMLEDHPEGFEPPRMARASICEFKSTEAEMLRMLGTAVHVFLLDIPRFEFAAIIPKGCFATAVMVGDDLDDALVNRFLGDPVVQRTLPTDIVPCVCSCKPLINVGARKRPYGDRIAFIGDAGVTRLYKDGIGAALRTGKAAAMTAVLNGISKQDFENYFWPTCRNISIDNAVGRLMFATNAIMKNSKLSRRVILRMAQKEQANHKARPHMSSLLWNMFTGSAPYTEMFKGTFHPGFIGNLFLSVASAFLPHSKPHDLGQSEL